MKGKSRVYDFLVFYLPLNLNIYIYIQRYMDIRIILLNR